jgi:16S rRNA processing protein RimM
MTDLIAIGEIIRPHGVQGAVKVSPLTDFPERFKNLRSVHCVRARDLIREIQWVRLSGPWIILKFRGIDRRDDASALKGTILKIFPEDLVVLPAESYYTHQIIGLSVVTTSGEPLGEIIDVLRFPANDVYVMNWQGREFLIPAAYEIIRSIDLNKRLMTISPLPGLLE